MHPHLKRVATAADQWSHSKEFILHPHMLESWNYDLSCKLRLKNDLLVDDHILRLKNVADHLSAIGEAASNRDLILHAISALDVAYNLFVSSFTVNF